MISSRPVTPRIPFLSKITRPTLSDVLQRERLFHLLDGGMGTPITWICAPAGSGKTTLAASWLESRNAPCLWYQVDNGDGDLATFFYYMGLAAKKAAPKHKTPLPILSPEYLLGVPAFTRSYFEELFSRLISQNPPKSPFSKVGLQKNQITSPPLTKGGEGGFTIVLDNYQDAHCPAFHEMTAQGPRRGPGRNKYHNPKQGRTSCLSFKASGKQEDTLNRMERYPSNH